MVDVQPDDNISPAGTTAHSKEYPPLPGASHCGCVGGTVGKKEEGTQLSQVKDMEINGN